MKKTITNFFLLTVVLSIYSILFFCISSYSINACSKPAFLYKGCLQKEPAIQKIYSSRKYDRYCITFSIKNKGEKSWIGGISKGKGGDRIYLILQIKDCPTLKYVLPRDVVKGKIVDVSTVISIPKLEGIYDLNLALQLENHEKSALRLIEVMKIVNYIDENGSLSVRFITEAQDRVLIIPIIQDDNKNK